MSLWLDHLIFGNGHGMASPYFDNRFFWLVDTLRKDRSGRNGRLYNWIGGLGAQLTSWEWTAPKAGTRRRLAGREFKIFSTERHGLRVECSWCLARLSENLDAANSEIRDTERELGRS